MVTVIYIRMQSGFLNQVSEEGLFKISIPGGWKHCTERNFRAYLQKLLFAPIQKSSQFIIIFILELPKFWNALFGHHTICDALHVFESYCEGPISYPWYYRFGFVNVLRQLKDLVLRLLHKSYTTAAYLYLKFMAA